MIVSGGGAQPARRFDNLGWVVATNTLGCCCDHVEHVVKRVLILHRGEVDVDQRSGRGGRRVMGGRNNNSGKGGRPETAAVEITEKTMEMGALVRRLLGPALKSELWRTSSHVRAFLYRSNTSCP